MRNLVFCLLALAIISCKNEPMDYVKLSGHITDKNSDSVVIRNKNYSKTIRVNEDGTFSDTLKVDTGIYSLYDGGESTSIFLKNGFDINISLDTKMFDETITYTGNGAEHSNFLAKNALLQEELLDLDALMVMDSVNQQAKFAEIEKELVAFCNSAEEIDTAITNRTLSRIDPLLNSYKRYIADDLALKRQFPKGADSPTFEGYENFNGESTSLSDLKGKYVYVDVWATWCGPCKVEIPSLKKVASIYKDKNIEFVSISVDDDRRHGGSWEKANESWKKMVEEKELSGVQLYSPKGWQSEFIRDYKINSIPRFILIDPEGKVVSASAPRPSSEELLRLFEEENI